MNLTPDGWVRPAYLLLMGLPAPPDPDAFDVVVPVTLRLGDAHLSWLTTLVTFAAPVDVTVDELVVVECFFPAGEGTERWVEGG